ncbi:MAG: zinc-dependent metalloprotease [Dermatophilaceae bacterium]
MPDRGEPPVTPPDPEGSDHPEDAPRDRRSDDAGPSGAAHQDPDATSRSPMGFDGTGAGRSPASGETPEPGATGIPGLDEILRMIGMPGGGAGGVPDLEAMMRSVFGEDVTLPPELTQMLAALRGDAGTGPMAMVIRQQLGALFGDTSSQGRLDNARDIARKVLSATGDRVVTDAERRDVADAVTVARLWLDPVTAFDSPPGPTHAWSGSDWVEATTATWYSLVEPVSDGVARAGSAALRGQLEQFGGNLDLRQLFGDAAADLGSVDLSAVLGQVGPVLEGHTGAMFAAQIGQAIGTLAGDILGGTEVGLPLVPDDGVALLPARVAAFADDLQIDQGQVRLYIAVREAARARLFAQVPWLATQLEAAVRDYGRNITIDTEAIEAAVRSIDVSDMAALQQAFSQAEIFGRRTSPEQQAALTRLEATLALVEGWVDLVTDRAVAAHLPQSAALGEAVRRRRAGGPAQKVFAGLVGLELRPRRLVDARNLWAALEQAGGIELRDGSWDYPDLAPTTADLDDPLGYVEKRTSGPVRDAMDVELDRLLSGQDGPEHPSGDQDGQDGPDGPAGPADSPADPPSA